MYDTCMYVCMYDIVCDAEQVQRWGAGAAWWCGGYDDEGRGALRTGAQVAAWHESVAGGHVQAHDAACRAADP